MGDHPLRPPTRPRLGRPLPYQLADGPQPPPSVLFRASLTEPLTSTSVRGISGRFQPLSPAEGQVSHVLLTRSPLSPSVAQRLTSDLHVLGTPPAFILSQDQTLRNLLSHSSFRRVLSRGARTSKLPVTLLLLRCCSTKRNVKGNKNAVCHTHIRRGQKHIENRHVFRLLLRWSCPLSYRLVCWNLRPQTHVVRCSRRACGHLTTLHRPRQGRFLNLSWTRLKLGQCDANQE